MSQTPEELEAEVELQREQLGETVDQLAAKLDVKTQAQARVHEIADRATTDTGAPRPELYGIAGAALAATLVLLVWRRRR